MAPRYYALILGIAYVLVAILGFVPGINDMSHPGMAQHAMTVGTSYGYLLGLFPVNVLHNLVHLVIGVWGLVAYRSFGASRDFARITGVLFILLAVMGLVPGLDTTFGLIPLFGNDIWLHALTGIIGLLAGFLSRSEYATQASEA